MSSRIGRNISILLRAERLIARRQMALMRRQTGMAAAAAILGAVGLVMLNVAGFFGLSEVMQPALAALVVAVVNLVFAAILLIWARGLSADREVEQVTEVRDMAIADLEGEVEDAAAELRELAENLRRMAKDPLGTAGASLIGPLLSMLLKHLRK